MRSVVATLLAAPALVLPTAAQRADLDIHEWTVPWENSPPRDPSVYARGRVWFVGQVGNYVANLDPATGTFTRFAIDSDAHPHNQVIDTGARPNRLIAFDTKTRKFVVNQPIGGAAPNTIRYMVYHAGTREIWYGSDLNVIGRVRVPQSLALVP